MRKPFNNVQSLRDEKVYQATMLTWDDAYVLIQFNLMLFGCTMRRERMKILNYFIVLPFCMNF